MVWTQLKLLWPSFAGYWVFLAVVLTGTHYVLSRSMPRVPFKWAVPVTVSTAIVAIMVANSVLSTAQSVAIYNYQQNQKAQETQGSSNTGKAAANDANQLKADFLKTVEQLVANPEQINDDVKAKVFAHFGSLFAKPEDKTEYLKNIGAIYECQRFFWEDALASFQAKKEVKSDARAQCEKYPGTFFGREKLMTPESVKNNGETIAKLSAHKRLPAAEGKTVDVNESMLRATLERQIASLNAVKRLFQ